MEFSIEKKIRWIYGRVKELPAKFWMMLVSLIGVADFLTWWPLSDVEPSRRIYWTLGLVVIALVISGIGVWKYPTKNERMEQGRIFYRRGRELRQNQNYEEAKESLEESISLDPENVSAWALLGAVYLRLGLFKDSIPCLEKAIKLTQINEGLYRHNLGVAYFMLQDYGRAKNEFDRSLKLKPKRTRTLRWRSQVWLEYDQLERAYDDVSKALTHRPTQPHLHAMQAVILGQQGKLEEAEKKIKHIEELQPTTAEDFYFLAMAYKVLGQIEKSKDMLKVSVDTDSRFAVRATLDKRLSAIVEEIK